MKPPGAQNRPSSLRFGLSRNGGSRAQPGHQVVSIFFFCLPWIPPKFQFFLPTFLWISRKIPIIINEIQVTKIKKYEWFTMKSNIGDFGQNCSTSALAYIKVNLNTNNNYIQFTGLLINIMPQKKNLYYILLI